MSFRSLLRSLPWLIELTLNRQLLWKYFTITITQNTHVTNIPPVLGLAPLFRKRLPKHKVLEISHVWCHQGHVPPTPQTASRLPPLCVQEATTRRFNLGLLLCTWLNRRFNAPPPGAIAQNENENNNNQFSAYHEGIIGNAGASHRLPKGRHGRFVLTVDGECRAWGVTRGEDTFKKKDCTQKSMKWSTITKCTWNSNIHMQYRAGAKGWSKTLVGKINSMAWVKAEEFPEATPKTTKQAGWSPFHSQLSVPSCQRRAEAAIIMSYFKTNIKVLQVIHAKRKCHVSR